MLAQTLNDRLPRPLAERIRHVSGGQCEGAFVLYWMRTALRAHDNPALDVALHAADALGVPVFVYHGLSERYPHASDRHHTFILQGAVDVQRALQARGVGTAFHLERTGHRGAHLAELGELEGALAGLSALGGSDDIETVNDEAEAAVPPPPAPPPPPPL